MADADVLRPRGRFLASRPEGLGAAVTLVGAPLDATVSFRPGTRFAPGRIREVSEVLEEYSPGLDRSLEDVAFYDAGDVDIPPGSAARGLDAIGRVVDLVAAADSLPLLIGGEHSITGAAVAVLAARYPDLAVIQFDAHADLRADYLGEELSHATVMRRVAAMVTPGNMYQLGIRSGTREEFGFARKNTNLWAGAGAEVDATTQAARLVQHRPVYVTIDLDVVDPGSAPGVGTPEPGGWTPGALLDALYRLDGLNIVGADVVELCPPADAGDVTAVLGAKVVREMILLMTGGSQVVGEGEPA